MQFAAAMEARGEFDVGAEPPAAGARKTSSASHRLADTLDAIYSTPSIPNAEKQRLASLAVGKAMADSSAARAIQTVKQLDFMEEALQRIAKAAQVPSITITDAKRWLREWGGHKLASRLSRASKARNVCAHPDVGWLDEVDQLVRQRDNPSDTATNYSDDRTTSCSDGCKELEPDGLGVWFANSVLGENQCEIDISSAGGETPAVAEVETVGMTPDKAGVVDFVGYARPSPTWESLDRGSGQWADLEVTLDTPILTKATEDSTNVNEDVMAQAMVETLEDNGKGDREDASDDVTIEKPQCASPRVEKSIERNDGSNDGNDEAEKLHGISEFHKKVFFETYGEGAAEAWKAFIGTLPRKEPQRCSSC